MFEKLHYGYLPFQAIRDRFVAHSGASNVAFGALNQIRQALCAGILCSGPCDNLDCSILVASLVSNHANPRTAALPKRLAKLPVADVGFASPAGSIGGSGGYGRIALGISPELAGYLREAFVFRRICGIASAYGKRAIGLERLIVRQFVRRDRARLVRLGMLGLHRRSVCSVLELAQGQPSARLLAAVAVLLSHITIVLGL